jgi:Kef-type K+ transport system membrane component KefB
MGDEAPNAVVELAELVLLFSSCWAAGELAQRVGCPALVAEIVVGLVLGPAVLDVVPFVDALTALGQLGLLLLVLEGGLNIELATMRRVGWRAFAIAISGTTLPVLLTLAVLPRFEAFSSLEALCAGTALSSTAIGMATKLMVELGMLKDPLGQLICCAAMIDDVASLVLLAMIASITKDEAGTGSLAAAPAHAGGDGDGPPWGPSEGVWAVLIPLISSLAFLALAVLLAAATPRLTSRLPREPFGGFWLALLFAVATGLTVGAHYCRTTFLLGCFMGGVAFAAEPRIVGAWEAALPPIAGWSARLFFASIGFAVPADELFSAEAIGYGALLTAVAVLAKVVTGVFHWERKWTVGWAMVGRGELGFVMAEEAYRTGLTGKLTFSVTVWALLLATLVSPVAFKWNVRRNKAREAVEADRAPASTRAEPAAPCDAIDALLAGEVASVVVGPDGEMTAGGTFRGVLLAGSFDPLHAGHEGLLAAAAAAAVGRPARPDGAAYELAVTNADKGALAAAVVRARVAQFAGRATVVLTAAPTFGEKAAVLPGCDFVIGCDTAVRIVMPKYYGGTADGLRAAMAEFARCGCGFVVAGRVRAETGAFETFDAGAACARAGLDAGLFKVLTEREFRVDLSSSEIRDRRP